MGSVDLSKSEYTTFSGNIGNAIKVGDTVCIELNLNEKYLEFSVIDTDKSIIISFTKEQLQTNDNLKYRLTVSLVHSGDCYKLINFE